jgi:undecaprenyl diphosphate synthase
MIYRLYEKILLRDLRTLPEHICFMITEQDMLDAPDNLFLTAQWCHELGIGSAMFHISTADPARLERCLPMIRTVSSIARLTLHYRDEKEVSGEGMDVTVAIGKSGREEIAGCVRRMAEDGVNPESVDEDLLESYLTFNYEPDLVIKRAATTDRLPHLAVGLLRTLLPRRQLGPAPESGFSASAPGLPVKGAPVRTVTLRDSDL